MRAKAVVMGAGLMLAASVAMAGPALATPICVPPEIGSFCVEVQLEPVCVGTDGTIVVCGDADGATYISDCVYAGSPPCTQVTVNGPTAWCAGAYGSLCILPIQH